MTPSIVPDDPGGHHTLTMTFGGYTVVPGYRLAEDVPRPPPRWHPYRYGQPDGRGKPPGAFAGGARATHLPHRVVGHASRLLRRLRPQGRSQPSSPCAVRLRWI